MGFPERFPVGNTLASRLGAATQAGVGGSSQSRRRGEKRLWEEATT